MYKLLLIVLFTGLQTIQAQTVLMNQNFDTPIAPNLPAGWSSTSISGSSWRSDSSNFSNGYTDASALKNVVIRNSDSSGVYELYSPVFSTINYKDISILWASRVSNNFVTSGSTTPTCKFSIDGGSTWSNVAFLENNANSTWDYVNGGMRIMLSALANNQPTIQFKWTVSIVNNSQGTYRMDDVSIEGTLITGIEPLSDKNNFTYSLNNKVLRMYNGNGTDMSVKILDCRGREVISNTGKTDLIFNLQTESTGIYFIKVENNLSSKVIRVWL
jgi:hypothetical protein